MDHFVRASGATFGIMLICNERVQSQQRLVFRHITLAAHVSIRLVVRSIFESVSLVVDDSAQQQQAKQEQEKRWEGIRLLCQGLGADSRH